MPIREADFRVQSSAQAFGEKSEVEPPAATTTPKAPVGLSSDGTNYFQKAQYCASSGADSCK